MKRALAFFCCAISIILVGCVTPNRPQPLAVPGSNCGTSIKVTRTRGKRADEPTLTLDLKAKKDTSLAPNVFQWTGSEPFSVVLPNDGNATYDTRIGAVNKNAADLFDANKYYVVSAEQLDQSWILRILINPHPVELNYQVVVPSIPDSASTAAPAPKAAIFHYYDMVDATLIWEQMR